MTDQLPLFADPPKPKRRVVPHPEDWSDVFIIGVDDQPDSPVDRTYDTVNAEDK